VTVDSLNLIQVMLTEGKLMSKSLIGTEVLTEAADAIALTFVLKDLLSPIYARA